MAGEGTGFRVLFFSNLERIINQKSSNSLQFEDIVLWKIFKQNVSYQSYCIYLPFYLFKPEDLPQFCLS